MERFYVSCAISNWHNSSRAKCNHIQHMHIGEIAKASKCPLLIHLNTDKITELKNQNELYSPICILFIDHIASP